MAAEQVGSFLTQVMAQGAAPLKVGSVLTQTLCRPARVGMNPMVELPVPGENGTVRAPLPNDLTFPVFVGGRATVMNLGQLLDAVTGNGPANAVLNKASQHTFQVSTLTALIDIMSGTPAQGAMLAKGASAWGSVAAGSTGQNLRSAGAAAPAWSFLGQASARTGQVTTATNFTPFGVVACPFTPTALLVVAWCSGVGITVGMQTANGQFLGIMQGGTAGVLSGPIMGFSGAHNYWTASALSTNPTFTVTGTATETWNWLAVAFA